MNAFIELITHIPILTSTLAISFSHDLLLHLLLTVIEIDVVCLPLSHLSAFEKGSRMWRRIRRGRNVSVFSVIKPEKCRMSVLTLVSFV